MFSRVPKAFRKRQQLIKNDNGAKEYAEFAIICLSKMQSQN